MDPEEGGGGARAEAGGDAAGDGPPPVSCARLFRYATWTDVALALVGAVGGATLGLSLPLFSVVLGGLFDDFSRPGADIAEAGRDYAVLFSLLGAGAFVAAFVQVSCFTVVSERVTLRTRKLYLDAILRQDISWFDQLSSGGGLNSTISENTVVMREGILKLGELVQFLTMFVSGFVIGFYYTWQLTLVILGITPALAAVGFFMMKFMADATSEGLGAYAAAGAIAEETFQMIRTVTSFTRQRFMIDRYERELVVAEKEGIRKASLQGVGMGLMTGIYFMAYALAFWYGSILVLDSRDDAASAFPPDAALNPLCAVGTTINVSTADELLCFTNGFKDSFVFGNAADVCSCLACACGCTITKDCIEGGDILLTFFAVIIASFSLGQAGPSLGALTNARAAAAKIFEIIERRPDIDASGGEGRTLDDVEGNIELSGVHFAYPSRSEVQVFQGIDLAFPSGSTTALVGGSGCGKSTVTQLILRFYDPDAGSVSLDGVDIRDLDLAWLRNSIGLVSQEPILFATSIADNIAYGAVEHESVDRKQIEEAARAANAYDFISELADGFDSFVGEGGSSLSGGQKQRIAIARALVRDPSILILDEATSALDSESERIVQSALDDLLAKNNRTTIVIAHRLTTIRDADNIVVLGPNGAGVLEQGSHSKLIGLRGHYSALLAAAERTERRAQGTGEDVNPRADDSAGAGIDLDEFDQERETSLTERLTSSHLAPEDADDDTENGSDSSMEKTSDLESGVSSLKEKGRSDKKRRRKKKKKNKKKESIALKRIFQFSVPEKRLYVPAIIAAAINGIQMPIFAILFAEITNVYFQPTSELVSMEANKFALYFVAFGVLGTLSYFFQFHYFGIISERMTRRIRSALFGAMLRQDIGFYDRKSNSVGALSSKLSTDAALVKASLSDRSALLVTNVVTILVGFGIAFYYGWKLTLVLLALLPIIVISGALQVMLVSNMAKEDEKALSGAGQLLQESVSGIRTVSAFGLRTRVVTLYDDFLKEPSRLATRKGFFVGFGVAVGQGVLFAIYALAFYYGAILIVDDGYTFLQLVSVFFAVIFVGMGAGQAGAMAPDVGKASSATESVFSVLDRASPIDPLEEGGLGQADASSGDIVFDDVAFAYPTRRDATVLRGFSLTVPQGKNVALVGMSGSGKSSALALLERFYDPRAGSVRFHGIDVREADVGWLRSCIGYVEQEPRLFSGTIFENIAFGLQGEPSDVPKDRVEQAAQAANAADFIAEFPDGYDTVVGTNGSQLSGGQKQRICLARMLIREGVSLFLLDEATSALDTESEGVVQAALDRILQERREVTTITVAHRLSTIRNCDLIVVVHHGAIVELGRHDDLIRKNGPYARLYRAQKKEN